MASKLRPGQELDGAFSGLQVRLFRAATHMRVPVTAVKLEFPTQTPEAVLRHLQDAAGMISVAGFGSLLSKNSALYTFSDLVNFRAGKVTLNYSNIGLLNMLSLNGLT